MPHFEYYEGSQRIQREAVIEVLQHHYRIRGLTGPVSHLVGCETAAVGKFGRPKMVLQRKGLPDITVKIAR